jgi:peptidoglycan hydrolase CwlO-like protein
MDVSTQIYGLMAVAEEQQKAVATALDGLMQERVALEALRTDLISQSAGMKSPRQETVSTIQSATEEIMRDAVTHSIAGVSDVVVGEFRANWEPFLADLSKSTASIREAARKVQSTTAWLAWRWLALLCCFLGCALLLAWLATTATIARQRSEIKTLQIERTELASEVLKLQEQADVWSKKGGRAKLEVCGTRQRLCVRVDKKVAYGVDADHYVLSGY